MSNKIKATILVASAGVLLFTLLGGVTGVRASNDGGISFYKHIGFRETGRRRDYYAQPKEDAVLLVLKLSATDP